MSQSVRQSTNPTEARFWAKVDRSGDCWNWTAYRDSKGYGTFRVNEKMVKAHRFSYTLAKGAIPEGKLIDHRCMNRSCVNPDHLRPATDAESSENRALIKRGTASGIRGVCWSPKLKRWMAYASKNRRRFHVGIFDTIEEAAEAARLKRNELFTYNESDRTAKP